MAVEHVGGSRYGCSVSITDDLKRAAARPLAAHHPIGISTGVFAQMRGDWPELVTAACRFSPFAIELSALSGHELPGLVAFLRAKPRMPFRYASVHAPAKDLEPNETTIAMLNELPLSVRSIVVHPDALSSVAPYRTLGTRLVIENMDDRKVMGRVADELEDVFEELPDAGFCLDVAHARSIDPSMDAAHELLDRFRSRLRQVHLSSLDDGRHVPVTAEDETLFADVLERCRDVPWILEAVPPERWSGQMKTTAFSTPGLASSGER